MKEKQVLNTTETAEFLGVSRRTVYEWRKQNFGPKFKKTPSGRPITTRENCEQFLAKLS